MTVKVVVILYLNGERKDYPFPKTNTLFLQVFEVDLPRSDQKIFRVVCRYSIRLKQLGSYVEYLRFEVVLNEGVLSEFESSDHIQILLTRYRLRADSPVPMRPTVLIQGYLAHKKTHPRTLQQDYAQGPVVFLGGWAFFHKRGTPVHEAL